MLGNFLVKAVPIVANGLAVIIGKIKEWFNNLKNGFVIAFNFIRDKVTNITNKVKELVTNVINKIKELPQKVISIGKNLVEGLWNGINDKIAWVKNKISGMGSAITNAIKGVFGIASPSKVFAGIGGYLAEGLGVGFEDEITDVKSDMVDSMSGLTGNMTATVSAYGAGGAVMNNSSNYNGGAITINVYGAEGQDVNTLAEVIAVKLEDMTRRREMAYA